MKAISQSELDYTRKVLAKNLHTNWFTDCNGNKHLAILSTPEKGSCMALYGRFKELTPVQRILNALRDYNDQKLGRLNISINPKQNRRKGDV